MVHQVSVKEAVRGMIGHALGVVPRVYQRQEVAPYLYGRSAGPEILRTVRVHEIKPSPLEKTVN